MLRAGSGDVCLPQPIAHSRAASTFNSFVIVERPNNAAPLHFVFLYPPSHCVPALRRHGEAQWKHNSQRLLPSKCPGSRVTGGGVSAAPKPPRTRTQIDVPKLSSAEPDHLDSCHGGSTRSSRKGYDRVATPVAASLIQR